MFVWLWVCLHAKLIAIAVETQLELKAHAALPRGKYVQNAMLLSPLLPASEETCLALLLQLHPAQYLAHMVQALLSLLCKSLAC